LLQVLGEQLVGDPADSPGDSAISAVLAGLKIQEDTIALRQQIHERSSGQPDATLAARGEKLQEATQRVIRFEEERDASLPIREQRVQRPIVFTLLGAFILAMASLVAILLNRIFKTDRNARAL